MSVANVGIKLTLDGAAQAEAGLRRVQGGMDALGNTAESVRSALQQMAGAFAGVVSVRAFVQAADAVTQLQNQLKLATGSTQAATQAYQQLFDIAQRSRVSFTELGGTFASIARASESLGLSQQQLLRLTETIGNAITVGGQSAAASQAALVQLSQGLASGVLRGEELNSILEQAPRLARALADGLGVSTGALRKLGEEGKLTADAVIGALQSQAGVLASEVQNSVVTVGQAFTQVQNSATKLVGEIDRVSGSSTTLAGALQAASESLDGIARAFKDAQSAGQQASVFSDGIATVFETVAVLGVNVAYVIKQIGTELGGLAAQAVAVASGQFAQAREIGRLMREDAEKARREVDALSERILSQRRLAEQARTSLQGVDTRAEDARLARLAQSATSAFGKIVTGSNEAKKAADDFAKSVERGVKLYGDLTAQSGGLSAGFAEQWKDLSAAFQAGKISLEQLVAAQAQLLEQQPFAKDLAKEQADAIKQQAEAMEAAAKAEFERIGALERSAASAEEQLQRLLDEEKALTIAAEKNITLAQALEEVAIARLRERQAAMMAEGDRDAEVLAIQREIDARKQLAEAIGRKEASDAAIESAKDAAREWERTAERIQDSITDALMRGFESGKDFAANLRDTIVNMFKT
ncbi:tape measure protein, partial [Caldimonas sp.]|uniref:tape measure protein n=1 Tax=Caldimonas sp. TaxID=2838790 RepID=UPI003918BA6B